VNEPFQHWVLEGAFDADTLRKVLAEWPAPSKMLFKGCSTSIKAHNCRWGDFGETTKAFIEYLNSAAFIKKVEELTGIDGLIADPELKGGGLHEIPHGGFLNMHVDFNWHPRLQAVRKLNLLLYLNENWQWNGELILSKDGRERTKVIAPLFNRCVLFPTTDTSWHGHPDPLTAPHSRRSIALYYYRKEPQPKVHSTIYAGTGAVTEAA
jgi:hypothetical protein